MHVPYSHILRLAMGLLLLTSLAGCGGGGLGQIFGLNRSAPDEFSVLTKAPLVIPPNSNLRPPEPGAPRPQELNARDNAQSVLTGRRETVIPTAGRSVGETALLRQAGSQGADPSIRQLINSQYTQLADKDSSFTDRLLFWQPAPEPGQVIDARKEASRLRQNQATGQSVNSGETPVIERRKRAVLEGIFN